ncbi:hypothetical protein P4V41_07080 [Fictibacillus nanhaiensis]|uniref:hypothetical protein n=1 Tax=Fictibacillus nanhaiensis TaxID=742169 RepID=UPI002E2518BA|nr:hypothetical protein [Fictibacillus nanhaiensis]
MQIENSKSVISKLRKGDSNDPFVSLSEQQTIYNQKVVLSEVPSKFDRVTVTGDGITWNEIDLGIPGTNTYVVDYNLGVVSFSQAHEGKTLTFSFKGRGANYLAARRIWTREENGEVTETLQTLVDTTEVAREEADLAATSLNHKGSYNSTTQYKRRNIVNYAGNSYMALVDVKGASPTDETKWKKLSGFAFKNTYLNTTSYETGDYVQFAQNEQLYMSLVDNNIGNPVTDTSKWKLVVSVKEAMDGVRDATADARVAEDAAIDATVNANLATENANSKATFAQLQGDHAKTQGDFAKGIGDNLQHKGDYSNSTAYKKGNVVWYSGATWMCIQDTSAGVLPTQASYWRVISNETTLNAQNWTATANQTVFTIANGNYIMGGKHLKVWVGGVQQYVGQGFTETTDTSFTLSEGVPAGVVVRAEWFEGAITIYRGHTSSHYLGGNDELDASKLKNYQPYHVGLSAPVNKLSMWIDTSS